MTVSKALQSGIAALLSLLVLLVFSASVLAATPSAGLTVSAFAEPTHFEVGHVGRYKVTVTNSGSEPTNGGEIKVADELPAGLAVQGVAMSGASSCESSPVVCRFTGTLRPDETLQMLVQVLVEPGAPAVLTSQATVSGGGAGEASAAETNDVSSSPAPFGPSEFNLNIDGLGGGPDRQAGDHPYEMTTTIGLDNADRASGPEGTPADTSVQDLKDVVADLPLGFVGSTLAAPECPLSQLSSEANCPADTIVGHILTEPQSALGAINSPIYNLVPERGVPAEFGYIDILHGAHVFYSHVVPSPAGYVLQVSNVDIPAIVMTNIRVTFYGDPAAKQQELAERNGEVASALPDVPFFTDPTECSGLPLVARVYMDSWQNPGTYEADGAPDVADGKWVAAASESPPVTGCDALQFTPELVAQPTTHEADKPSGLELELKQPQSETMGVPATATVRNASIVFPAGFTLDPSAGDGLAACSETQIGWTGPTLFDFTQAAPECPEASKVGTLELETPLIGHTLTGEMYLASQNENPYHATIGLYVVVQDPITGVLVKIAGQAVANQQTGQLTSTFDENPSLPFSDLKLHFFGGPRASFATPETCGTFTTSSELFPYSFPESGPAATPFDTFLIDEACPAGFNPSFMAGSTNLQAGAYTPFETSLARSDTDQELIGLSLTLPSGLLAKIAGVSECGEAEIHAIEAGTGNCPPGSRVGTVTAGAGPGPNPLFVTGAAFLTGPYNGGPFGLAVVVPAVAGPFNFGTVVVRQSLRIDPHTAQVTDVSDPFPKIIDGVPLRLRRVDLSIDRPEFTFNPTSCAHEQLGGVLSGAPLGAPTSLTGDVGYATEAGASSPFTTPFQVTNCTTLKFTPSLAVATAGKASKTNGASLNFKITYPKGAMGSQSWFNEAKFSLPKQLPARLGTLQKACLAATFETNRQACPAASKIGTATVHTEVLPVPLKDPSISSATAARRSQTPFSSSKATASPSNYQAKRTSTKQQVSRAPHSAPPPTSHSNRSK